MNEVAPVQSFRDSFMNRLRGMYLIGKYQYTLARKKFRTRKTEPPIDGRLPDTEAVTVYVINTNNRDPLELTLRTLFATTDYPNFKAVVADNQSTDGSVELVESLMDRYPVELMGGVRRDQHEWYDHFMRIADTRYWVSIHEDMIFFHRGWLTDMIRFMDENEEVDLLGGEYFPPVENGVEPVSHAVVDLRESLSTWIFCVRTTLREKINSSFEFYKYHDSSLDKTIAYDQGGKLIEDMRNDGLGFACMPTTFMDKWHHVGNISWAFKHDMNPAFRMFKNYQLRDISRRAKRLRRSRS